MKSSIGLFGVVITILVIITFIEIGANEKTKGLQDSSDERSIIAPTPDEIKWVPATILGLKVGVATEEEVRKTFGKPNWEGQSEEEPDKEYELEYHALPQADGSVVFGLGKRDRIVNAITIYPKDPKTRDEIITQFGSDFYEQTNGVLKCHPDKSTSKASTRYWKDPTALAYPSRGLYVEIQADNKVNHIGYLAKCSAE